MTDFEKILNECKDELAIKAGYSSWKQFQDLSMDNSNELFGLFQMAAILAMQKVREECVP